MPPQKEQVGNKGIYVLIINLSRNTCAKIGALGQISFPEGTYAYMGSAQKNFEQRVKRHLRKEKRIFWHIDYLLSSEAAKVVKVLYREGGKAEECRIASEINGRGEAVKGFGCSDCDCYSHLFRVGGYRFLLETMKEFSGKALQDKQNTKRN